MDKEKIKTEWNEFMQIEYHSEYAEGEPIPEEGVIKFVELMINKNPPEEVVVQRGLIEKIEEIIEREVKQHEKLKKLKSLLQQLSTFSKVESKRR